MSQLKPAIEFDHMIDGLEKYEANTYYDLQDLRQATFNRDSDFGSLSFPNKGKLELNVWSARQLCKRFGVPLGVFQKSSEDLAQKMVAEFGILAKEPEVKLSIKKYGNREVIRGILPVDYPEIRNSDVLHAVKNTGVNLVVQQVQWMDVPDPPITRTRFVAPDSEFDINGDTLNLGIDVMTSELGGAPMQFNLLLYRQICENGVIACYGAKPYFYYDYEDVPVADLTDIFNLATKRMEHDFDRVKQLVGLAMKQPCDLQSGTELVNDLLARKLVDKGVALKALAALQSDTCTTVWDVVNAVTSAAKTFRDVLRLRYEQAAGLMLGMDLPRDKAEERLAEKAKVVIPPKALPAPTQYATSQAVA